MYYSILQFHRIFNFTTPQIIRFCTILNFISGIFVTLTMGLSTLSVVTSVLVLYLHHRGSHTRLPNWLRYISFHVIAKLFCMHNFPRVPPPVAKQPEEPKRCSCCRDSEEKILPRHLQQFKDLAEMEMSLFGSLRPDRADVGVPLYMRALRHQISTLTDELKMMTESMQRRDEEKQVAAEWQAVARIIDRLLFWIVLLVLLASVIWFLLESFREFELDNM